MGIPNPDDMATAIKVASYSSEGLNYLSQQFDKKITQERLIGQLKPVSLELQQMVQQFEKGSQSSFEIWSGQFRPVNTTNNIQQALSLEAIEDIQSKLPNTKIRHDIQIENDASYIRAFSKGGQTLEKSLEANMDTMFNSWLAEKGYLSKNSTIYQQDEKGSVLLDKNKRAVKAEPEVIRTLLKDEKEGFEAYMSRKDIDLSTHQKIPEVQSESTPARGA